MDILKHSKVGPVPSKAPVEKELTPKEREITIQYETDDGLEEGIVISRIMSAEDRVKFARTQALFAGAIPWASYPPSEQGRFRALATIQVQLHDAPDWLVPAVTEDDDLLYTLANLCEEHEASYFRRDVGQSEGDSGKNRLVLVEFTATGHDTE